MNPYFAAMGALFVVFFLVVFCDYTILEAVVSVGGMFALALIVFVSVSIINYRAVL